MKNNLIKSAFTVFITWWVIFTGYAFYKTGMAVVDEMQAASYIGVMVVLGGLLGGFSVYYLIRVGKEAKKNELRGDNYNGLICTVGQVPLVISSPQRRKREISISDLHGYAKDVPHDYFINWKNKFEHSHPQHVELFLALVQILSHDETIPATHVPGGHGNRTLFEHSLLAAYIMDELGKKYEYSGLKSSKNNKKIIELSDDDYRFNSNDPLLAIVGLAHDIGKIEAYVRHKETKAIVGIKSEHDLTGARMLARVDEMWALPEADRRVVTLAVAHYHHPMSLPLSPSRRAVDDRTIAIMELLINADTAVSAIEARSLKLDGYELKGIEEEEETSVDNEIDSFEDEKIYQYIIQCIKEKGRINNSDTRFNIGSYCQVRGFNKPMLVLRDDSLRNLVMQKLGVAVSEDTPGGVTQMGARIRSILDSKGILIKEIRDRKYNSDYALWSITFLARESPGAEPKVVSNWKAVNIIDPSKVEGLINLKPYYWMGDVQDGVFKGSRTVKTNTGQVNDYEGLSADEVTEQANDAALQVALAAGVQIASAKSVDEAGQGPSELTGEGDVELVAKTASAGFTPLPEDLGGNAVAVVEKDLQSSSVVSTGELEKNFTDVFSALLNGTGESMQTTSSAEVVPDDHQANEDPPMPVPLDSQKPAEEEQQDDVSCVFEDSSSGLPAEATGVEPALNESAVEETSLNIASDAPDKDDQKAIRRQYQPNIVQGLIVGVARQLISENKKLSEHAVHGYLLSSNTLITAEPSVPWLALESILREYCEKGKAAYKVHDAKSGNAAFVITIDKDLI